MATDRRRVGLPPHARPGVTSAETPRRAQSTRRNPQSKHACSAIFACSAVNAVVIQRVVSRRAVFAQQTHLLVITGVPGDDGARAEIPDVGDDVHRRGEEEGRRAGRATSPISRTSSRRAQASRRRFADLGSRVKPGDAVFVLLLGHGSFNGTQAAFNLPARISPWRNGRKLLAKLPAQRVAFVNTTSSSGAFLSARSRRRAARSSPRPRPAASATRRSSPSSSSPPSTTPAADRDRNGHVSVAEAFEYAKTKVAQAFQQKGCC